MTRAGDLSGEARAALYDPDKYSLLSPLNLDPDTAFVTGVANVRPDGPSRYVPDVGGLVVAAIVSVMPPGGELIDLVAIDIAQPDRWRRRTGLGDMLGEDNVFGLFGEPLLVHPGPLEWLRAEGDGVAVLEYTPTVCGLLNALPGGLEVADDPDFAEALEQNLTVPERRPRIFVRQRKAA